ncbi:MAG: hypothetical protein ABSB61_07680 [Anaerolineales bacterium]|jgi:hypothetical protein
MSIWRKALYSREPHFGSQAVAGELIELHPHALLEASLGHHEGDMGFKGEVAAEGMDAA